MQEALLVERARVAELGLEAVMDSEDVLNWNCEL